MKHNEQYGHPGVGGKYARLLPPPAFQDPASQYGHLAPGTQADRVEAIILSARDLFLEKNKGYGDTAHFLGAKGQFADMNRKFWKLYQMLWTESLPMYPEPPSEDIEQILMDFIGHAALTIDFLREEDK